MSERAGVLPATMPPPAPRRAAGLVAWLRASFFGDPLSTAATLVLALAAALLLPPLARWALLDSVWTAADPETCRAATGACWAVIREKHRVILFGTYPYEEQWRGALVVAAILGLTLVSTFRRTWSRRLLLLWAGGLAAALVLQRGGVFGLPVVETNRWGGLPLTLLVFVGTVTAGTPLAVALALGRRSRLAVIRALSVAYIEVIRGVPLVNVLFMASLLFPLFMPEGVNLDKLLRAQLGMIIFYAAYTAEAVRGGLQAIPRGQYEAADALGLPWWLRTTRIILPQALRIVVAPIVNDVIRAFKNTSLLVIIGLFDVLGGTMAALEDPRWARFYVEAYLFIALLYFAFCFPMSKYSQRLERLLRHGRNY